MSFDRSFRHMVFGSAVSIAAIAATPAQAQQRTFEVRAQSAARGVSDFARQAEVQILISDDDAAGRTTQEVRGRMSVEQGLEMLLAGTGLQFRATGPQTYIVIANESGSATRREASGNEVLTGKVMDGKTGVELDGARVEVVGTDRTTATDALGNFRVPGLAAGTYTVRIRYLGLGDHTQEVEVGGDGGLKYFVLGNSEAVIMVYGQLSARAQALNQERTAQNVSTVISADDLGSFNGTTLSESLRRAPAVTFNRDRETGDGANITIRGLAPDFNAVKFDGVSLPVGSGTDRSASLSNILTESISKVTISKTLLPSQDSAGTGGLVEIETKTPLDRKHRYASFTVEGARRAKGFAKDFLATGTLSGTFGADRQFGLSASLQYREKSQKRVQSDVDLRFGQYLPLNEFGEPISAQQFIDPRTAFPFEGGGSEVYPASSSYSVDTSDTTTWNLTLSAAWAIADHTKLFLDYQRLDENGSRFSQGGSIDARLAYRRRPVEELGGETRYVLEWRNAARVSASYSYTPELYKVTDLYSFRGESNFDKWQVKYRAGFGDARTDGTYYSLSTSTANLAFGAADVLPDAVHPIEGRILSPFAPLLPGESNFVFPLFTQSGSDRLNDPRNLNLSQVGQVFQSGENSNFDAELGTRYQAETKHLKYVEVGGSYKHSRFGSVNLSPNNIAIYPVETLALADLGLNGSVNSLEDIGISAPLRLIALDDFLGFVEQAKSEAVECFPDYDLYVSLGLTPPAGPCPVGTRLATYSGDNIDPRILDAHTIEDSLAGYVEAALQFGKLEIIGGVRATRVDVEAVNLVGPRIIDENGNEDLDFFAANNELLTVRESQTDYLPRILANLRLTDDLVLRAGYYLSVARPSVGLLSARPNITLDQAPFYGPNFDRPQLYVFTGNPDLKPSRTHSFDFSAELYDQNVGVIKLGAFYKRIDNLLESLSFTDQGVIEQVADLLPDDPRFQDVINNPQNYEVSLNYPINNPAPAHIWGIETTVEKQFPFLPGVLGGLGAFANYTYTDSSKEQPGTGFRPIYDDDGSLIDIEQYSYTLSGVAFDGQPKHSGTVGLTYTKYGIDANVAYTFQSRRLNFFADYNLSDYEEAYGTLDMRAEYRFDRGRGKYRIYLEGSDLLRSASDASLNFGFGGTGATPTYIHESNFLGGREVRLGAAVSF